MKTPGMQTNELRKRARELRQGNWSDGADDAELMLQAADTITSLWNSLTASEAALNKAAGNWARCDADLRENQGTRYSELFGTPERAAQTWIKFNGIVRCADCPICNDELGLTCEIDPCAWVDGEDGRDALTGWLKGDAE